MVNNDRKRSLESALVSSIQRTKQVQSAMRTVGSEVQSGETESGDETVTVTTRRLPVDSRDNAESERPAETG